MSYDYLFAKLTKPVESLAASDGWDDETIGEYQDWKQLRKTIAQSFPEIVWEGRDQTYGSSRAFNGRFEIDLEAVSIRGKKAGLFKVMGSHNSDQSSVVVRIAIITDFSVFDMQTLKILYMQKRYAENHV